MTARISIEQMMAAPRYIFELRITDTRLATPHAYDPGTVITNLNTYFSLQMGDKIGFQDGLPAQAYRLGLSRCGLFCPDICGASCRGQDFSGWYPGAVGMFSTPMGGPPYLWITKFRVSCGLC